MLEALGVEEEEEEEAEEEHLKCAVLEQRPAQRETVLL